MKHNDIKKTSLLLILLTSYITGFTKGWVTPPQYMDTTGGKVACAMTTAHDTVYTAFRYSNGHVGVARWDSTSQTSVLVGDTAYSANLTFYNNSKTNPDFTAITIFDGFIFLAMSDTTGNPYGAVYYWYINGGNLANVWHLANFVSSPYPLKFCKQFIVYKGKLYLTCNASRGGLLVYNASTFTFQTIALIGGRIDYTNTAWYQANQSFNKIDGIYSAAVYHDTLYLGGKYMSNVTSTNDTAYDITAFDGSKIYRLAYNNKSTYSLWYGSNNGFPKALSVYRDTLYVGGSSNTMHFYQSTNSANRSVLLKYENYSKTWWGTQGILPLIDTATTDISFKGMTSYNNKLFMTFNGNKINNLPYRNIASYDGTSFSNLQNGVNGSINAMISNSKLIIGGAFDTTGTIAVTNFGIWDDFMLPTSVRSIEKKGLSVYPNPSSTGFTVSGLECETNYIIYDISGRILVAGILNESNSWIEIENIPSGIYLIKLTDRFSESTKRLTIY